MEFVGFVSEIVFGEALHVANSLAKYRGPQPPTFRPDTAYLVLQSGLHLA